MSRRWPLWLFGLGFPVVTGGLGGAAGCGGDDLGATAADASVDTTVPAPDAGEAALPDSGGGDVEVVPDASDAAAAADASDAAPPVGASVLQFHLNSTRDGHYVDALMTPAHAATLAIDPTFDGTVVGPVWSQPLYVENGPGGEGIFLVASDSNDVYGLSETTGKPVWHTNLGPAPEAASPSPRCGNVHPIGVTGTPVIDLASRTMFLDSGTSSDAGLLAHHWIHALSIDDGSERSGGWPIDVNQLTSPQGGTFAATANAEDQRSALSLINGILYVPYGGHAGDSNCGNYNGWVVAVPIANPSGISAFSTPAAYGGIWAPGGGASDGTDLFVTTGNTSATVWGGGEAVLRFHDGTALDLSKTTDFFYPSNWLALDGNDIDLGGSNPILVDVPGATPSSLLVQMGKNGVMYLLDRTNLGGAGTGNGVTGEGLYSAQVAPNTSIAIINAGAAYTTAKGTYVVFYTRAGGASCPAGMPGNLVAVRIEATSPPTFTTVWCQGMYGDASPIVTTTDATSNPIVWVTGAEADNQLHGYDGDTGAQLYGPPGWPTTYPGTQDGGDVMQGIIHFTTVIDVKGRIFVGAGNQLYAFKGQ